MTALGTDRDTLIHDLLEICVPRLGEVIGEPPTIGETRPVGGVEVPDGPVVRIARDDEVFILGLVVQPPDGGDPASVDGVAQAIADELVAKGPEAGYEISNASGDALGAPEAFATGFEVGDRLVGTVMTLLSIETDPETAGDPVDPESGEGDSVAGSTQAGEGEAGDAETSDPGVGDTLDATGDDPTVAASEATAVTGQGAASVVAGGAPSGAEPAVLDPTLGRSLGTLSQVELNVTVQLGSAELAIRDLMALSPGSVVRVGTQIGEPFPVLVNGRIAARGDLVVVNGRLGVRIRELISG